MSLLQRCPQTAHHNLATLLGGSVSNLWGIIAADEASFPESLFLHVDCQHIGRVQVAVSDFYAWAAQTNDQRVF